MSGILILLVPIILFIVAYFTHGNYIARMLGISVTSECPAHLMRDDIDYCPTPAPVLWGHHFASIAGAGPIIGPIAASVFGWLPVFLWIIFGGVLIGCVHDFQSIVMSLRHKAKTVSEVLKDNVGVSAKKLFAAFATLACILIMAVFAVTIARTYVATPAAATASLLVTVFAVIFGSVLHKGQVSLLISSIVGVGLVFLSLYLGMLFPLALTERTWIVVLLAYGLIASAIPVWVLLQPRDYLDSFLLYAILIGGVLGIIFLNPTVNLPVFTTFTTGLGPLFPILFVTVACGAVSGFHSLVSTGTTSKQISSEAHAQPIGYGSMLVEGVLAVMALLAVSYLTLADRNAIVAAVGPIGAFSAGVGHFLTGIGIPLEIGRTFAAMAIAAFAITTLDTCVRLTRFLFAELIEPEKGEASSVVKFLSNRWVAGVIVCVAAGALALPGHWAAIWPIFGSANQLLASLALLAGALWLYKSGKPNWYVVYPMIFMLIVSISALVILIRLRYAAGEWVLVAVSVMLLTLACALVYLAVTKYLSLRQERAR